MAIFRVLLLAGTAFLFAPGAGFGQMTTWYKCYTGTIDKYPVTMHLYKTGHSYTGNYYYDSRQELIYCRGQDSIKDNTINVTSFLPDQETTETFIFTLSGNMIKGEWKAANGNNSRTLTFSAKENSGALAFDFVYTEGSAILRPKLKESPAASFEAASVWPKGNSPFLKKVIREEFGQKTSTEDIGKIFLRQKKEFLAGYLNDNKELKDEDLKEAYSYNLDQTDHLMIVYQSPGLIVLAHSNYAYTGGAHGNYGTSYIPIDPAANKKIGLKDVINEDGQKQLSKFLERSFRRSYSLKDKDSLSEGGLFENKIEPNNNFYITAKGIGFCYNPYEIGPYAMGEINLFIPFSELTPYLKPGFKQLIQ